MYNPTRRNRNIGTIKQGHGQNNKMCIPFPVEVFKSFCERLTEYDKETKIIAGDEFTFVIERTIKGFEHACSVNDVALIIEHVPKRDLAGLRTIIFRQPKRKEVILSPVWGRLIYSYEFEGQNNPAIILEAADYTKKLKWPNRLSVAEQKEFKRLVADGHKFVAEKNKYVVELKKEAVRNTQLYRTLIHEIGHYAHYLEIVERPGKEDEPIECWCQRDAKFDAIPSDQKEEFAHNYAERLFRKLTEKKIIAFP